MKLLKLIILLLMCLLIDGEEANNQNIGINGLRWFNLQGFNPIGAVGHNVPALNTYFQPHQR